MAEGAQRIAHIAANLTAVMQVHYPPQAAAFIRIQQGRFGIDLGCAFAPNHKGMPVLGEDDKIDFLRRQVTTSRNIRGGWLTATCTPSATHLGPNPGTDPLRRRRAADSVPPDHRITGKTALLTAGAPGVQAGPG